MRSTWSAKSSLDVGGSGWGGRAAGTWDRGLCASQAFQTELPTSSPLDMASILIPLLLLLLLLLAAGVVFWYKRRVRG